MKKFQLRGEGPFGVVIKPTSLEDLEKIKAKIV